MRTRFFASSVLQRVYATASYCVDLGVKKKTSSARKCFRTHTTSKYYFGVLSFETTEAAHHRGWRWSYSKVSHILVGSRRILGCSGRHSLKRGAHISTATSRYRQGRRLKLPDLNEGALLRRGKRSAHNTKCIVAWYIRARQIWTVCFDRLCCVWVGFPEI